MWINEKNWFSQSLIYLWKENTIMKKWWVLLQFSGNLRNIYFPFDIITDTPIDVATEMVKELEISDRDPFEIAEVIGEEISALVPHWKEWGQSQSHKQYTFSYEDDEDNEAHHPFYYPSSPSSQASVIGLLPSQGACYHTNCPQGTPCIACCYFSFSSPVLSFLTVRSYLFSLDD